MIYFNTLSFKLGCGRSVGGKLGLIIVKLDDNRVALIVSKEFDATSKCILGLDQFFLVTGVDREVEGAKFETIEILNA